MQAGLGLGAGLPLGQQIGRTMSVGDCSTADESDAMTKLTKLKSMLDSALITEEQYESKRDQILSEF